MAVLVDSDATFDRFRSHMRSVCGSGSIPFKLVYSLKCEEAMSVCVQVPIQEDLNVMLYLYYGLYQNIKS